MTNISMYDKIVFHKPFKIGLNFPLGSCLSAILILLKMYSRNIKKNREQKGWSQEILAEKLNFTKEYICRIERGQKYISLKKLFLLADILCVNLSDLINFK